MKYVKKPDSVEAVKVSEVVKSIFSGTPCNDWIKRAWEHGYIAIAYKKIWAATPSSQGGFIEAGLYDYLVRHDTYGVIVMKEHEFNSLYVPEKD